ncbi:MAG: hypothetical protein JNL08_05190 [Planctomycetes bacterium]|nr:hypothetical protein [Planctomycetota bacterium]
MHASLLSDVRRHAAAAGLNLFGLVDAERFDAASTPERRIRTLAPGCGSVVVVGSGGRELWQRFAELGCACSGASAEAVDGFALAAVRAIEAQLAAAAVGCRTVGAGCHARLPFARLGEAAGFGTVSPVTGLLLHPEFGPWVRVRAALLVAGQPFGPIHDASISDRFQPCCGCPRPCVAACPVGVHDGAGRSDLARCAEHRHGGNCASHCSSRSACPVGSAHRDGDGEHAHRHTHSLRTLQRWYGHGVWRLVPPRWRGSP